MKYVQIDAPRFKSLIDIVEIVLDGDVLYTMFSQPQRFGTIQTSWEANQSPVSIHFVVGSS